ncbi:hypothetical protein JOC86_003833 [Bacillus pakistanensis]|uniref:DUF1772 domain-containing protein n=1 Tax=Rossellomorea pakistanensis TaxID=992288 RepID=A0ABS2NHH6_9BACI|nr:hypothetical protein [Bacillus pakistanensis]MBM7587260.1 hypothetical protein [Bacillus pakistanensis]
MKQKSAFLSILSHLWVQLILLGSILLDTFMVYPNIFHDIPRSFETALDFMEVASPHTYFPPLGLLSWVTGLVAVILGWSVKSARYWILGSVIMMFCEGLSSMVFEWPRNEIMFIEGVNVHSVEFLKQTAQEFLVVHGFRVAFNLMGSVLIFIGFMKYYKHIIMK